MVTLVARNKVSVEQTSRLCCFKLLQLVGVYTSLLFNKALEFMVEHTIAVIVQLQTQQPPFQNPGSGP